MMKIRPEQCLEFEKVAHADFRNRLVEYLRTELPEETAEMDDQALRDRVADGLGAGGGGLFSGHSASGGDP